MNGARQYGVVEAAAERLVRVDAGCVTGDIVGSQRWGCGPRLEGALQRIGEHPDGGMLVYMAGHEGRGIGLWAKAATYLLQDGGQDTYQANRSLGLPDDDLGARPSIFTADEEIA